MNGKFYLVEVEEKEVNPERVKFANQMADFCARQFHFRRPRIRWFRKTDQADFRVLKALSDLNKMGSGKLELPKFAAFEECVLGFFAPREDLADSIFLRNDLGRYELRGAFCHELAHFLEGVEIAVRCGEEREPAIENFEQRLVLELSQIPLFA